MDKKGCLEIGNDAFTKTLNFFGDKIQPKQANYLALKYFSSQIFALYGKFTFLASV